jgi:drug/metabolite transporter (DMT)-like permease
LYIKRKACGVKLMAIAGGSQLFGGLALMPFLLMSAPQVAVISPRVAIVTFAFAVLCSAVAYVIYYRLIADIGPTKALTVTFLIPIFAILWQSLIFRKTTTWSVLPGAALILAGTYLVTAPQRKQALTVSR